MIGKTTIRRGTTETHARASVPTLRVLDSPGAAVHTGASNAPPVVLAEGSATTIGRTLGATILLEADGQVSRTHATVTFDGEHVSVTDSSTNGTYVMGKRIPGGSSPTRLRDGDVLRVGDSFLILRMVTEEPVVSPEAHGLLGDAPVMHDVRRTIALVGPTDATVLVIGPSGTGKEVVARALHAIGRPNGPFVAVNCSAIPESLAESQLFGHVAGAFTGAKADHPGFFRAAHGGVIFLDEVGELPLGLQAKLLRALEERSVIPVGAVQPVPFDARVVAATNRSLALEVAASRFRGDLLARLAEIEIAMPPLDARREDILPLLRHSLGAGSPPMSPGLVEELLLHTWPFNVREVVKVGKELAIRGAGMATLDRRLVADRLKRAQETRGPVSEGLLAALSPIPISRAPDRDREKEKEKERALPIPTRDELVALLTEHKGSVADVARATDRSRKQVYRWIESHGLDVETFRNA